MGRTYQLWLVLLTYLWLNLFLLVGLDSFNPKMDVKFLKELRKKARASTTKRINKLQKMMETNTEPEKVQAEMEKISEKLKEARNLNEQVHSQMEGKDAKEGNTETKDVKDEWDADTQRKIKELEEEVVNYDEGKPEILHHDSTDKLKSDKNIQWEQSQREEMMEARIDQIKKSMKLKASKGKIEVLTEKISEKMSEIKIWVKENEERRLLLTRWMETLEMRVDDCIGETKEHVMKKVEEKIEVRTTQDGIGERLKRIEIPKFSGTRANYFNWKASFNLCVDSTQLSNEVKFLHLKQALEGEALRTVENLVHSPTAYTVAREILEEKYGGERRKAVMFLERVDRFTPLKNDSWQEIQRMSDMLNLLIINLHESNRKEELGNGLLYYQLQKKFTKSLLEAYRRWIEEKSEKNI